MHCGYLPREEWPDRMDGVPRMPDGEFVDVCPGWLVRQPAVIDGSRLWKAFDKSALAIADPEGLSVVLEMVEIYDVAIGAYRAHRLKKA